MKKLSASTLFLLISFCCLSQTQAEINRSAINEYLKADKKLNEVYNQIIKEYKDDTAFISNLKVAQRIWVQSRDAEIKMMYPDREPSYYGSIHPLCLYDYKKELTEERIKKLKQWLEGSEEGDSCSSSKKSKS